MTKRTMCAVLLWFVLVIPEALEAQGIGGRLRQRAQDAVSGEKKPEQAEVDKSKVFINDVIEISEAGMKGFLIGLDTEVRLLTEFAALLDTYKPAEEYAQCQQEVTATPEAMEIFNLMATLGDSVTAEQMQAVTVKMNEQFMALMLKKCGPSIVEDWPQTKRNEKLKEIVAKSAAAAGPVRAPEPPASTGGPSAGDDEPYVFVQQQGLTSNAYDIFKERVIAYCAYKALKGDNMPVTPGDGYGLTFAATILDAKAGNVSWVFTADEVLVMDANCDGVILYLGKITQILEMAPINIKGQTK